MRALALNGEISMIGVVTGPRAELNVPIVAMSGTVIRGVSAGSRAALQRCRRSYPTYAVIDDHEIANDFNGAEIPDNYGTGTAGDTALNQLNWGLQAYWENMPVRAAAPTAPAGSDKKRLSIEKTVRWGSHVNLVLWDCRQDRTDPDSTTPTMLGAAQVSRTVSTIQNSTATWTVFGTTSPLSTYYAAIGSDGQPVLAGRANWNAYPVERERITGALRARLDQHHVHSLGCGEQCQIQPLNAVGVLRGGPEHQLLVEGQLLVEHTPGLAGQQHGGGEFEAEPAEGLQHRLLGGQCRDRQRIQVPAVPGGGDRQFGTDAQLQPEWLAVQLGDRGFPGQWQAERQGASLAGRDGEAAAHHLPAEHHGLGG
jgi:hypothetical protein